MPTVLRQFLSPAEVTELRGLAASATAGWQAGRQHTGYDILPLRAVMPIDAPLVARGLAHVGTPFEDYWDVYFIRYLDGAYIPPHTDPAEHGRTHRRINAVLTQATCGGELVVDGETIAIDGGDVDALRDKGNRSPFVVRRSD